MIRRFLKDSLIYAIPALVTRGLSIFLVPLYTRVLSARDYGSFDLLMIFSSVALLLVSFEISQGVARYYAAAECKFLKVRYVSTAFWFTIFCYAIFVLLSLGMVDTLSKLVMGREGLVWEFHVGIAYIVLNAIFGFLQNQFRWELRGGHYALASLIFSVISALGAVFFAYFLRWGLLGLLTGLSIGALSGVIYGLINLRSSLRFKFDLQLLVEMLSFSLPLVPAGLLVVTSIYVDRVMINNLMSVDSVGLFGVGVRLASAVGLVMVGFQGALTPLIYAHYREADTPKNLAKIFRYFVALSLLVCAGVSLFAKDILMIMTTPQYYAAASVVAFIAPALMLAQMYIFAPGIGIAKKTHYVIWINFIGVALGVALGYLLIPVFGIEGAAFCTLLCNFATFVVYMKISQGLYYVPHKWRALTVATVASVVVVGVVMHLELEGVLRWGANCLALAALALLFVFLGLVPLQDLYLAKGVLRRVFWRDKSI